VITVSELALQKMQFPVSSPLGAVQAVRARITSDDVHVTGHKGVELINLLLGTQLTADEFFSTATQLDDGLLEDFELMTTQAVAETVVKMVGTPMDEAEVLANAKARAMKLLTSPEHKWMFAKAIRTTDAGEQQAVVEGVDVKVAVKTAADGSVKIKKGGKEVLAEALYAKYVDSLNGAEYNNQAFIAILVKELGMSKAGATTYNYNMKKKHGGKIDAKGKKA
jgi:hypothetical protein